MKSIIKLLQFGVGIFFIMFIIFACEKEPVVMTNPSVPSTGGSGAGDTIFFNIEGIKISNGVVDEVGFTTVEIKGEFSSFNATSFSVIDHGHVLSKTNSLPTFSNSDAVSTLGEVSSVGQFTSLIEQLEPGTRYFARAYIKKNDNSFGYHPGSISFKTKDAEAPDVAVTSLVGKTSTSLEVDSRIIDFKGEGVIDHGVVWSKNNDSPTIENADGVIRLGSVESTSAHSFRSTISGLSSNTAYYIKAFASNSNGVAYDGNGSGLSRQYTTAQEPTPSLSLESFELVTDENGTGEPNPGELVSYRITLNNSGDQDALGTTVNLSSNQLTGFSLNPVSFGSVVAGGSKSRDVSFRISSSLSWGENVRLSFQIEENGGRQWETTEDFVVSAPYVVTDNLVLYYNFDNTDLFNIGQVENLFGGNNGVVNGEVGLSSDSPSNDGLSLDFPGVNGSNVKIPQAFDGGSQEFSFSFWMKSVTTNGCIFDGNWERRTSTSFGNYSVGLYLWGTKMGVYSRLSNYHINSVLLNNQWHHVVITREAGGFQKIYFDGEVFDEFNCGDCDGGGDQKDAVYGYPAYIGNDVYLASSSTLYGPAYRGKIDNFRFYNRTITRDEVQTIYAAKQ